MTKSSEWQPIEDFPYPSDRKYGDVTRVLIYGSECLGCVAAIYLCEWDGKGWWCDEGCRIQFPTHFMMLPELPL